MLQSLFDSQRGTILTVFVIFIMFLILFRSFYLSIIGIVPNLLAAGVVLYGVDVHTTRYHDYNSSSISVGAVDNTIHYIHRFKVEFRETGQYKQS